MAETSPLTLTTLENFLTPEEFEDAVKLLYWGKKWGYTRCTSAEDHSRFWGMDLNDDPFYTEVLPARMKERGVECGSLFSVYANGQSWGQEGTWHQDCEEGVTCLWYPLTMEMGWGGKTMFNDNGSIVEVAPQQNTLISFPANVFHKGEAPSLLCPTLRVSVAWLFE